MSEREAFVAAIAANPADDLPRLVFADWLDENGEPERAEFIRTQIRWHHADDEERERLNARAELLCGEYGLRWLEPFISAIEPQGGILNWHHLTGNASGWWIWRRSQLSYECSLGTNISGQRGLISSLQIPLADWPSGASLTDAFRHEPPDALTVDCCWGIGEWAAFSDPALLRIRTLALSDSVRDVKAVFSDPHLAGVRRMVLTPGGDGSLQRAIRVSVLSLFARSPLAQSLNDFTADYIDDEGTQAMCESRRLKVERLSLPGDYGPDSVRRLAASGILFPVRELALESTQVGDEGATALAERTWPNLRRLSLKCCGLSAAGMRSLAASGLLRQLERLDLSENHIFASGGHEARETFRLLLEAVNPNVMQNLDISETKTDENFDSFWAALEEWLPGRYQIT